MQSAANKTSLPGVEIEPGYGYVHSIDTGSMMDGPGMRLTIFLSGCPLRCSFCHNPDTWQMGSGAKTSVADVLVQVDRYARFLKKARGGVTISGGEPLLQSSFLARLLKEIKARGIHTVLETSGISDAPISDGLLRCVDLFLVDLKKDNRCRAFCERLGKLKKKLWLSLVLMKGENDSPNDLKSIADWAISLGSFERFLVRPVHLFGAYKWKALGMDFKLTAKNIPSKDELKAVREYLGARGLPVAI